MITVTCDTSMWKNRLENSSWNAYYWNAGREGLGMRVMGSWDHPLCRYRPGEQRVDIFVLASLVPRPFPAIQYCTWKNGRPFQHPTWKSWEGPGDEGYVSYHVWFLCVNLLIHSKLCLSSTAHFILSIRVLRLKVSQTLISTAQCKAVHWRGLIGRGREENGDKSQLYVLLIFNLKVVA